jgi:hypothetical protein
LKPALFFQVLHQRGIDESFRIDAGGFAAQPFQQAFDAFELDIDCFRQVFVAVDPLNLVQDFRIVETDVLREDFQSGIFITANFLDALAIGAQNAQHRIAVALDE